MMESRTTCQPCHPRGFRARALGVIGGLIGAAALAVACGDDAVTGDAGPDSTVGDAPHDAWVEASSDASDTGAMDAAVDGTALDGAVDADAAFADDASDAGDCDGGCKLFAYQCAKGPIPACTCLSLSVSDPTPTCDAGMVNCFKAPCAGKAAACVKGACVAQ